MKTCPFCKEQVHDDAIKCRYCQSMLLPGLAMLPGEPPADTSAPVTGASAGAVTYVVDRGIIQFGKFAAAVLAIFVVFGVYIFGIDVKDTVKRMEEAEREMQQSAARLTISRGESVQVQNTIAAQAKTMRQLAAAARTTGAELSQQVEQARLQIGESRANAARSATQSAAASTDARRASAEARQVVANMQDTQRQTNQYAETMRLQAEKFATPEFSAAEAARLAQQEQADPGQFRAPESGLKLWPVGETLTVRFLDGSSMQQQNFRAALALWLVHANLRVRYVSSGEAKLRVSFADDGSWSYVGTNALGIAQNEPTINLGFANPGAAPPSNYIHEIGHALGLVHENLNPQARLEYDRPRIYAALQGPPNNWDKAQIDANFFAPSAYPGRRAFDRASIMNVPLSGDFFLSGVGIAQPSSLSASDKAYVAALYPPT